MSTYQFPGGPALDPDMAAALLSAVFGDFPSKGRGREPPLAAAVEPTAWRG